jgi:hypothetical protein
MTTTTADVSSQSPSSATAGALIKAGLTGGVIAAVANTVLYGIARAAGVDFVARFNPNDAAQALFPFQPAVASLVPSVFAALVLLGLSKVLKRPAIPFAILATAFGLFSLGGPLNLGDASMATKLVLAAMHLVAGAAITVPLVRTAQR